MTIYDISKQAGVSIATVSRVLNQSSNVKESTRRKVMAIIEEYGYHPNAFGRGLGSGSMKLIGIACTDASDIYISHAINYIEGAIRAFGYDTFLVVSGYPLESRKRSVELLLERNVDAIILIGSGYVDPIPANNSFIEAAAKYTSVFLLNAALDYHNVYSIFCDDEKATLQSTQWMIDQGITDILFLHNTRSYSAMKKIIGFRKAFALNGLPISNIHQQFISGSKDDFDLVADRIHELKESGIDFSGIITTDDYLAVGAVKYAKFMGMDIPKDLMIIGYDNSILSRCCSPTITTVDNNLKQLCHLLCETVFAVLVKEDAVAMQSLDGELIHRETTETRNFRLNK